MTRSICVPIDDATRVAQARRAAASIAQSADLSTTEAGNLAIVVTELASNLLKHAQRGTLLLQPVVSPGERGVEAVAVDHGPGIPDVPRCMRDGYSTAGSPGTGLGAVARLASRFDVYSSVPAGTVVLAQVLAGSRERARAGAGPASLPFLVGAASTPNVGEDVCGDDFRVVQHGDAVTVLVADGLGHGHFAAQAATTAGDVFRDLAPRPPAESLRSIHAALRSTRGAAVAIAQIDPARDTVRFCGVGNIAAAIVSGSGVRRMVSHNGTAGLSQARIAEFTYPWSPDAVLVMHSDGLTSRWSLDDFPGLAVRHPAVVAAWLHRSFTRGRDDATVLVAKGATP